VIALPLGLLIGTYRPIQAFFEPLTRLYPLHARGRFHSLVML